MDLNFNEIFKWDLSITIGSEKLATRVPTPADAQAIKQFANDKELDDAKLTEARRIAASLFSPAATDASGWGQEICMGVIQAVFEYFKSWAAKNSRSISQAIAGGGVEPTSISGN